MKKIRPKIGDVFQITLPNSKYAYGRVYKDASIGIYKYLSDEPNSPPIGSRDFLFIVGMYNDLLKTGELPIIGQDKFTSEESAWPPPTFIKDPISGAYSIYYQGLIRDAKVGEWIALECAAVWDLNHIIERILHEMTS